MSNKKWKNVYCCNCGKIGHIYRICEDPITSFGVITFKLDSDVEEILRQMIKTNNEENNKVIIAALKDNIKLLMIRRKDTFGFVEILRGQYSISNIYPNPFNPITTISFSVSKLSNVRVEVFNLNGIRSDVLINNIMQPGYHSVTWDASDHMSGIYFVKMIAGDFISIKKIMLVK